MKTIYLIALIIQKVSFVLMIISGVVFVISLINSIKNKTGLFKYSFEYYDENGKFLYEEECTKKEYYASPKKEIISQSSRTKSM